MFYQRLVAVGLTNRHSEDIGNYSGVRHVPQARCFSMDCIRRVLGARYDLKGQLIAPKWQQTQRGVIIYEAKRNAIDCPHCHHALRWEKSKS